MYNLSDLPTFLHRKSVGFLGDVDPREEAIFDDEGHAFIQRGMQRGLGVLYRDFAPGPADGPGAKAEAGDGLARAAEGVGLHLSLLLPAPEGFTPSGPPVGYLARARGKGR